MSTCLTPDDSLLNLIDLDNFERYLSGCRKNENKSIEWMYKSFYGYLIGVALRYLANREVAEEVVNDSFLKIFGSLDGFALPEEKENWLRGFKGWIARITSRTALDYLRKPYHKLKVFDIALARDVADADGVLPNLYVKDIMELIYQLPDTQRIIFNLHEIEGYKHEEIANELGIEENVSRSYLSRARSKLKILYHKNTSVAI